MSTVEALLAELQKQTARMLDLTLEPEDRKAAQLKVRELGTQLAEASQQSLEQGLDKIFDDLNTSLADRGLPAVERPHFHNKKEQS